MITYALTAEHVPLDMIDPNCKTGSGRHLRMEAGLDMELSADGSLLISHKDLPGKVLRIPASNVLCVMHVTPPLPVTVTDGQGQSQKSPPRNKQKSQTRQQD